MNGFAGMTLAGTEVTENIPSRRDVEWLKRVRATLRFQS